MTRHSTRLNSWTKIIFFSKFFFSTGTQQKNFFSANLLFCAHYITYWLYHSAYLIYFRIFISYQSLRGPSGTGNDDVTRSDTEPYAPFSLLWKHHFREIRYAKVRRRVKSTPETSRQLPHRCRWTEARALGSAPVSGASHSNNKTVNLELLYKFKSQLPSLFSNGCHMANTYRRD